MYLSTTPQKIVVLLAGMLLLILSISASIIFGYTDTSLMTAIDAFTQFNHSTEHIVIKSVRLPRALIAACVGASLAVAGALMQALTKNPLASPDIFGVSAGAGFFVVIGVTLFSFSSLHAFMWLAFLGATVAALIVYFIGSFGRDGLTPMKLTLAGAAMAALFASFTQGLLVIDETALDQVLFWLAGSVQGRKLSILLAVLPYLIIGWLGSLLIGKQMNILAMGEDVAKGLGMKTGMIKFIAAFLIILLSGGSVAIAGPIGFIGIVVPHIARSFVGNDYRWILPYCAFLGGVLLLLADIAARYVIMPQEIPVGVMTAIIGTPFFIYIARKGIQKS